MKMEASQIPDYYPEISSRLLLLGGCMRNSSLQTEMIILHMLVFKYKNQHGHEKYYKGLEKIKKSLHRWKTLSIHEKVIESSKSICSKETNPTNSLMELLTNVIDSGKLAIRIIVLCQETAKYTLGYLSIGFFVAFHLTSLSLVSRIWALFKDFLLSLDECYQLITLLMQADKSHETQFPQCLTSLLSEDLNDVYKGRPVCASNPSSGFNAESTLKKLLEKIADHRLLMDVTDTGHALDLGEPVEDLSLLERFERLGPTPKSRKCAVSDLKQNLALKFDLALADAQKLETDTDLVQVTKPRTLRKSNQVKRNVNFKRYIMKSRVPGGKTLHRADAKIFVKKPSFRCGLRTLFAMDSYYNFSSKKLRALLAIGTYLKENGANACERRMFRKVERLLRREIKRRESVKNKRETGVLANTKTRSNHHLGAVSSNSASCSQTTDNLPGNVLIERSLQTSRDEVGENIKTEKSGKVSPKSEYPDFQDFDVVSAWDISHLDKSENISGNSPKRVSEGRIDEVCLSHGRTTGKSVALCERPDHRKRKNVSRKKISGQRTGKKLSRNLPKSSSNRNCRINRLNLDCTRRAADAGHSDALGARRDSHGLFCRGGDDSLENGHGDGLSNNWMSLSKKGSIQNGVGTDLKRDEIDDIFSILGF